MICCWTSSITTLPSRLVTKVGNGPKHSDCLKGCDTIICCQMSSAAVLPESILRGVGNGRETCVRGRGGMGMGRLFFFAQREEGERPKEAPLWVSENPLFS